MVKHDEYRTEALTKLINNSVSAANMEVWIAGYIAGRIEGEKELVKNEIVADTEIERLRKLLGE